MGETLAEFEIRGTAPDPSERSKRTLRIGASSSLSSCRTTGLILSGPAAFFGFKFFSSVAIPASDTLISGILGVGFLKYSGKTSWAMILSSTRSCNSLRESSLNPLVPKHRKHYQKILIFHPDTSFGELNRKQGLNLCIGQRLLRLACSIYATLGIKFSKQAFFRVNNSSINNNFRSLFE